MNNYHSSDEEFSLYGMLKEVDIHIILNTLLNTNILLSIMSF